jgi:hypothetical protein
MIRKQTRSLPLVEGLESRQLMSATHLSIPPLAGDVFTGTASGKDGTTPVTITIASESKSGKVTGTLVVDDNGGANTFIFKGTVTKKHGFSLVAINGKEKATLKGLISADDNTLTGKYVSTKPHHAASKGTFVVSK